MASSAKKINICLQKFQNIWNVIFKWQSYGWNW